MTMKRILDIAVSLFGLVLTAPIIIPVCLLIWLQDLHSPFYIAPRVGKDGKTFHMIKLRSMIVNADNTGVDSTSSQDKRITPIGHFIRAYKLDEIPQLWNVLVGEMSLVGPRPNVPREVSLYTEVEKKLLTVKPGITDLASIVFADEGEILKDSKNPDLDYNQLIRPWKSRLSLLYVNHQSFILDAQLITLTITAIFNQKKANTEITKIVQRLSEDKKLEKIVLRQEKLIPFPPPGSDEIVTICK